MIGPAQSGAGDQAAEVGADADPGDAEAKGEVEQDQEPEPTRRRPTPRPRAITKVAARTPKTAPEAPRQPPGR